MDFAEVCANELGDILTFPRPPKTTPGKSQRWRKNTESTRKSIECPLDRVNNIVTCNNVIRNNNGNNNSRSRRFSPHNTSTNETEAQAKVQHERVRWTMVLVPQTAQERALEVAARALKSCSDCQYPPRSRFRMIATSIKKEFDRWYGPAWHCIVGTSFGSLVTHSPGGLLYFSMHDQDNLHILLFKTTVHPI